MALFPFRKPKPLASLQEQGGELLGGVKEAAAGTASHVGALWQLFCMELREYAAHQTRRVVAVAVGGFLLFFAYALLCAFACVAAEMWLGSWPWATGLVCGVHFVAGFIFLLSGLRSSAGPVAPATRQELQNDWQCIKLLFSKENSNS